MKSHSVDNFKVTAEVSMGVEAYNKKDAKRKVHQYLSSRLEEDSTLRLDEIVEVEEK